MNAYEYTQRSKDHLNPRIKALWQSFLYGQLILPNDYPGFMDVDDLYVIGRLKVKYDIVVRAVPDTTDFNPCTGPDAVVRIEAYALSPKGARLELIAADENLTAKQALNGLMDKLKAL